MTTQILTTKTAAARHNLAEQSSRPRKPVTKSSHPYYTTYDPLSITVGGCGHTHSTHEKAVQCCARSFAERQELRIVVGFSTRSALRAYPLGTALTVALNEAAENADPDGSRPQWLTNQVRIGKYKGKTWISVVETSEGRSYLAWAGANCMKRTNVKYRSLGEFAAPVLAWWKKENGYEGSGVPTSGGDSSSGSAGLPNIGDQPSSDGGLSSGTEGQAADDAHAEGDAQGEASGEGKGSGKPIDKETLAAAEAAGKEASEKSAAEALAGAEGEATGEGASAESAKEFAQNVSDALLDLVTKVATAVGGAAGDVTGHESGKKIVQEFMDDTLPDMVKVLVEELAPRKVVIVSPDVPEGVEFEAQHPLFEDLLKLVGTAAERRVWISGPAGSGKTTAVEKVSLALGLDFYIQTPVCDKFELFGYCDVKGDYVGTPVYDWATNKKGGMLLLDEIDAFMPQALVAANTFLADRGWATFPNGVKVRLTEKHFVVTTANTWGSGPDSEYVGRAPIDAATKNRFPTKIAWPYDEDFERRLSASMGGKAKHVAICQTIRKNLTDARIRCIFSPRDTFSYCAKRNAGFTHEKSLDYSVLAELPVDQRRKALVGIDTLTPGVSDASTNGDVIEDLVQPAPETAKVN